jgi:hypothetical protein
MSVSRPLRTPAAALITAILTLTIPTSGTDAGDRRFCAAEFYLGGTGGSVLCEQPAQKAIVDTACSAFEPIRYSRNDTDDTKRQIRAHNAAWDALCKGQ